jgi:rhodanese-related sulfurtransferase
MSSQKPRPNFSSVLETPADAPDLALEYFRRTLELETDPADVAADIAKGVEGFVLVDVRSRKDYEERHAAGAISLPYRSINEETTAHLSKDTVIVPYCTNAACNASTKGAARFAALGFRVKEMIGGLDDWVRDGYPVEGSKQQ